VHHRLTNDLFHIDDLWFRVEPDTAFHRWLSQGVGNQAAITLTDEPGRFADVANVRILTGRLAHQTVPSASPVLHVLFLRDEVTESLGAVTFEAEDPVIAATFDLWAGVEVSVIVEIRMMNASLR
jgi:hypothetical protein